MLNKEEILTRLFKEGHITLNELLKLAENKVEIEYRYLGGYCPPYTPYIDRLYPSAIKWDYSNYIKNENHV